VLGSGGLSIGDPVSAFRELFADDELAVAADAAEHGELVSHLLSDEAAASVLRTAGKNAVLARHTYAHRAAQVCSLLGIPHGEVPLQPELR